MAAKWCWEKWKHPSHASSEAFCRKMVWMWNRVTRGLEMTFTARTQNRPCCLLPGPVLGGPGFRSVGWLKGGIRLPFGKGTVPSLQLSWDDLILFSYKFWQFHVISQRTSFFLSKNLASAKVWLNRSLSHSFQMVFF